MSSDKVTAEELRERANATADDDFDRAADRIDELEARNKRLEAILRELDERYYLGCITEPPCGNCTVCRARAALSEPKEESRG